MADSRSLPSSSTGPMVSTAIGQNKWVRVSSSYVSLLLAAASLATASPALIEVAATYVAANVSATVTSHVRHLPSFQGMRVSRLGAFHCPARGLSALCRTGWRRAQGLARPDHWFAGGGQDGQCRAYMRDHGCPCCRPMHRSCRSVRRRWVCRVANQLLRVSIRRRGADRTTWLATRVASHHYGVRPQRGGGPGLNQSWRAGAGWRLLAWWKPDPNSSADVPHQPTAPSRNIVQSKSAVWERSMDPPLL